MFNKDFLSVIESVGIPLELIDYRATYDYLNPRIWDRVKEFESKLSQIGSDIEASNFNETVAQRLFHEVKTLMIKYKDIFDKELYVLHMSTLLTNDIYNEKVHNNNGNEIHEYCDEHGNSRKDTENALALSRLVRDWNKINRYNGKARFVRKFYSMVDSKKPFTDKDNELNKALEFMKKNGFETYDTFGSTEESIMVLPSYNQSGRIDEFSDRLIQNKERFRSLNKFIGIEDVLEYIQPEDLLNVSIHKYIGNAIYRVINSKLTQSHSEDDSNGINFYTRMVMEQIQYLDPNKMLVLSLYNFYNKYGNDLKRFTSDELDSLKFRISAMDKMFGEDDITVTLHNKYDENGNEIIIRYKDLKSKILELDKSFINGEYQDDKEVVKLKNELISGNRNFSDFSAETIRDKLRFTNSEFALCLEKKPELIQRFVEEDIFQECSEDDKKNKSSKKQNLAKRILDILQEQNIIPYTEFRYLLENGLLDLEEFIKLYMKNKISLNDIERLKQEPIDNISLNNAVNSSQLMDLYSYENLSENFLRYRELFKSIKINDKSVEERTEIANSIITSYEEKNDDLLEEKMVYDLYKMGLLPITSVVEYVGETSLYDMIKKGICKPDDIRGLFYSGVISQDTLIGIMNDEEISNNEKLTIVYGAFSEPEEKDIRDVLISDSFNTTEESEHKPTGKKTMRTKNTVSQYYKRYKTDPALRWNYIKTLDHDFSQQLLKDGTVIFYLPNRKEYWIEKIFDLKKENGYGNATYMVEESVYRQNESEIIKNGRINRTLLAELNRHDPKKVKREIHSKGWGKRTIDERYTGETARKLRQLLEQIYESREEIL